MRYMLIHCVDESAWSDPATPRPRDPAPGRAARVRRLVP
jgi:hypothetical protein